jgi:hypothetical protein
MKDFLTIKVIAGVIVLGALLFFYHLRNAQKPALYKQVLKKYTDKRTEFFNKATELYPSKHLVNNQDEWEKVVDEQAKYLESRSQQYAIELHREFNLTDTDWKRVVNLYLQQNKK